MKRYSMSVSDFYCTECGKAGIPIPRKRSNLRSGGHLKILFCPYCRKRCNHAEVTPFGSYTKETFMEEFMKGRFVNGERVPIDKLKPCKKTSCFNNVNGKCWNAKLEGECII